MNKAKGFSRIGDVLKKFKADEDKYISYEFQKYGYDLADELGDLKSISLYIKLAKETPRGYLEAARNFVKDANNVKSKPKLFMWKLNQLKNQKLANRPMNKIK
ncbi:hypothetical protein A2W13_02725 [Candidatus Woesebacteria bacterium RBG_16_36_11]|uniref:Uncharacterized protein n=3 Tax=Candidatus Woeseibacteriota TaxID=1752722 RepID=A0A1F7X9N3_9BACT|nr:MAG: hypothetical protein A2Z67_05600 [Candidatus Woesebacteria bacterium RBG_13_36_22]OGM11078.1 MAG: hypothetical protein A2W13_02725 [Candidatus Woesebacteria bacterium RBG_16_36_11]OGM17139.1 MAG: hypothetical protein A2V55_00350 [Candidatus Woesebacteria bacterium RBG_19FT_COMBO_37_29]